MSGFRAGRQRRWNGILLISQSLIFGLAGKADVPETSGGQAVSNNLEYLKEMCGKWHLIERWVEVEGEHYKFTQDRDSMIVTDHMGAAFARLSVKIEGKPAPEGWFWLRNWTENEKLWENVSQHFELGTDVVQVSPYVETVAARFLLAPRKESDEQNG